MKRTILLAIIALAACSARAQIITTKGIDKITLGSSKEQVEKTLGKKIVTGSDAYGYGSSSQYIVHNGAKVYLSFDDDEGNDLINIHTWSKSFATREGARVGSTLADLKRIYGNKISMGDAPMGELFVIYGTKGNGQIIFDLADRKVVNSIQIVKEFSGFD